MEISTEDFMERYKAEVLNVEGARGNSPNSGIVKKAPAPWRKQKKEIETNFKRVQKQAKGKLSQFIKELKQNDKPKAQKKGEMAEKDKPLAILMIQPWERERKMERKGPMIIEAEIGGHLVQTDIRGRRASSERSIRNCFVSFGQDIKKPDDPSFPHHSLDSVEKPFGR
ncbi:hypothetical protein Tco_0476046 [Tanacetum coccineum]